MIFLTVGTLFPFDRLVRAVDDTVALGIIEQPVFAQIGRTKFAPKNIEYVEVIDKRTFDYKMAAADYIISHAGIGSITMALENAKPLLVMPRMKRYREHVNDHQVMTARKFEELGHILVAYDAKDLPEGMSRLKNFIPKERKVNPKPIADRISRFLSSLQD
jgi:UDP-N-acetylglucosamine transferase subunit ALG13